MQLYEVSLLLLCISTVLGVPFYLFFRGRMTDKNRTTNYSKKRVFKVSSINLFIILYITLLTGLIFIGIFIINPKIDGPFVFFSLLFLLLMSLTTYGSGIYITSVLLEAFTTNELKKHDGFHKQHTAINLFHGPISHILIYSGYIFVFFALSVISIILKIPFEPSLLFIFITLGLVLGMAYAIAQIANGTVVYQFVSGIICLLGVFIIKMNTKELNSLLIFFLFFCFTHTIFSGVYLLQRRVRGKRIYWYMPVDIFKLKV